MSIQKVMPQPIWDYAMESSNHPFYDSAKGGRGVSSRLLRTKVRKFPPGGAVYAYSFFQFSVLFSTYNRIFKGQKDSVIQMSNNILVFFIRGGGVSSM